MDAPGQDLHKMVVGADSPKPLRSLAETTRGLWRLVNANRRNRILAAGAVCLVMLVLVVLAWWLLRTPAAPILITGEPAQENLNVNNEREPDAPVQEDGGASKDKTVRSSDDSSAEASANGNEEAGDGGANSSDDGEGTDNGEEDPGIPPTTNCVLSPSSCGYPDSTNTGVPSGTTLTLLNLPEGYMDVTTPGTVIENMDIRGCIIVKAANVIIRNSKVSCGNYSVIYNSRDYHSGGGLLIENVEISCHDSSGGVTQGTGISEYGFTARNVEIHDCENGLSITDGVTLENSYIHSFYEGPTGEGHADGVQMSNVPYGIVVRHNTIFSVAATAAVNWTGQTTDVLIENNFMGGGAYVVYCPRVTIPAGAYRVIGNRFADSLPAFGFSDSCAGGDVTWTGNYKDSDLSAVTPL